MKIDKRGQASRSVTRTGCLLMQSRISNPSTYEFAVQYSTVIWHHPLVAIPNGRSQKSVKWKSNKKHICKTLHLVDPTKNRDNWAHNAWFLSSGRYQTVTSVLLCGVQSSASGLNLASDLSVSNHCHSFEFLVLRHSGLGHKVQNVRNSVMHALYDRQ